MRELTYLVAVSLDGFIAAPDGDFSAIALEGDHLEMLARDLPDTLPGVLLDAWGITAHGATFDTVLMGWSTYEVGLREGIAEPYPHLREVVVSARHTPPSDAVQHVTGDPVAAVRVLKAEAQGTGIWLCGGGVLASALREEIDRLVLKVSPVVLGRGIPLFAEAPEPMPFALERSTPYRSGVVVNEYRRPSAAGGEAPRAGV